MTTSLKEQFEHGNRRKRHLLFGLPLFGLAAYALAGLWPTSTLRDALGRVGNEEFERPYEGRPFKGMPYFTWNWVDESRRADMQAAMTGRDEAIEAMLRLAQGQRFLFHPSSTQGFIVTSGGPVFVFYLSWEKFIGFARDARGGPVLDLAPYRLAPRVVAVPLEKLADVATLKTESTGAVWRVYLKGEDAERSWDTRAPFNIHDPLGALSHTRPNAKGRGRS